MNWNPLNTLSQLAEINRESQIQPVMILKHSTRCSISSAALGRLERKWTEGDSSKMKPYYLDLIQYREVSNAVQDHYGVEHQSPQVLIISKGKCVYSATHFEIVYEELMAVA